MLWELVIMRNAPIDALGVDVSTMRVSVAPQLQTRFSVAELLTAHTTGSALAFV